MRSHSPRNSPETSAANSCGVLPAFGRRPLNLLAMFVGAGQEAHIEAAHPLPPRQRVRRHRGVRVPQMRARIHVVDRRGEEKRRFAILLFFLDWHAVGVLLLARPAGERVIFYLITCCRLRLASDPSADQVVRPAWRTQRSDIATSRAREPARTLLNICALTHRIATRSLRRASAPTDDPCVSHLSTIFV